MVRSLPLHSTEDGHIISIFMTKIPLWARVFAGYDIICSFLLLFQFMVFVENKTVNAFYFDINKNYSRFVFSRTTLKFYPHNET